MLGHEQYPLEYGQEDRVAQRNVVNITEKFNMIIRYDIIVIILFYSYVFLLTLEYFHV